MQIFRFISGRTSVSFLLAVGLWLHVPLALAGEDLLLDARELADKLKQDANYQLLDARSAAARQLAPLAFSKDYEKGMALGSGQMFVVADSDEEALAIVHSIPDAAGRAVFAVQGGAGTWKQAQAEQSSASSVDFIVPKGTCELGKPVLEIEAKPSDQKAKSAQPSGKR